MTFTNCNTIAQQGDINITSTNCGGICGAGNGYSTNDNVNIMFTNCNTTSQKGKFVITLDQIFSYNGGICGGFNGFNANNIMITFNNCFLNWCTSFNDDPDYPITYFYSLQELNVDPLIIIGDNNFNTQIIIDYNSSVKQECPPPPPEPPIVPPPYPLDPLLHLMEDGNDRSMTRQILRTGFNNKPEVGCSPMDVSISNCKKVDSSCKNKKYKLANASDHIRFLKLKAINKAYVAKDGYATELGLVSANSTPAPSNRGVQTNRQMTRKRAPVKTTTNSALNKTYARRNK